MKLASRRNFSSLGASALILLALVAPGLEIGPAAAGDGHSHKHMMHDAAAAGLVASNAISPATPPGVKTAAVYMRLENGSGADVDLVAVESRAFAGGHIHKTSMADGLMTMEQVAQLSIPAGGSVIFAPGGLHIMLTGAAKVLKPGDRLTVTLVFSSGQQLDVEVRVAKPGEMPRHSHGPMNIN